MPRRNVFIVAIVLLTGCSVYQSDFQCGIPPAAPCRSLHQVYAQDTAAPTLPPAPDPTRSLPAQAEEWTPPVKTVWIAPYVDTAGRRHEASILRFVVFPGARTVTAEPEFLIPPIPDTTEEGDPIGPPPAPPSATIPTPGALSRSQTPRVGPSGPASQLPSGMPPGLFTPPMPASPSRGSGFGLPGY